MSETRLLSVVFADLTDSTQIVARLGPDAGEAWRQRFLGALRAALAASRGREVQHTGDGVFAVFDSARDAVACAIEMQRRVAAASERRDADARTAAHVGIAVGEAHEDAEGVHGLVVSEAARLCSSAGAGRILATELVAALAGAGAAEFTARGALELKGFPAPVPVVDVAWSAARPGLPLPPRLAEFGQGSLAGRAADLARLDAHWQAARAGERRVTLIAGEPGIGKTRLAAELARRVHASGAIALYGSCDEDLGAPYQPWIQALNHLITKLPEGELASIAGDEAPRLVRLLPEIRRRLSGRIDATREPAEQERYLLFEALDALLARASRGAPLLIVIDDLHWADKPSLVLLRHVLRSERPAALLGVGTYRETDVARTHPLAEVLADLRRESRVDRLHLRGLDAAELGALVEARARHAAPEAFLRALHAETDGNPFFAGEVLRHLVETGTLRRDAQGWTLAHPSTELGIPEGVRDVVGRRLSRLSENANRTLRAASVIGREFELAVLERVTDLPRDELLDALDEAARVRIVTPLPDSAPGYAFAHALVRQTLYEELGGAQRMRLHWRVGEALELRHARELGPHAAAIAQHFAEGVLAGDALRAVDSLLRAGAHARDVFGHEQAAAHCQRALALLDQASLDEPERRYEAHMGEAQALMNLGDASFRAVAARAFEIARQVGWGERMAEAALARSDYITMEANPADQLESLEAALAALGAAASDRRARTLARRAFMANFADADYAAMEAGIREAQEVAETAGRPDLAEHLTSTAVTAYIADPDLDETERRTRRSIELGISIHPLGLLMMQGNLVATAMFRGDRAAVEARMAENLAIGERRGLRVSEQFETGRRAALALAEGRLEEARRLSARARDLAFTEEVSSALLFRVQAGAVRLEQGRYAEVSAALAALLETAPRWIQYQRATLAAALAQLGRADEARRELARFDALALQRRGFSWRLAIRWLAEAIALVGDAERAADLAPDVEPFAGQLLVAYIGQVIEGSADRARGQLAATLGRFDEAIARYESGLALEEDFGAAALAARTRWWLARALAQRSAPGDAERARREALAAHEAAARFGMVHLAQQAEKLVAALRT